MKCYSLVLVIWLVTSYIQLVDLLVPLVPLHNYCQPCQPYSSCCWVSADRVSTTPGNTGNTGNLLEFEIPPGNTGNLLDFC